MNRIIVIAIMVVLLGVTGTPAQANLINGINVPPVAGVAQSGGGQFAEPTSEDSLTPIINAHMDSFFPAGNPGANRWAWLTANIRNLSPDNVAEAMSAQIQIAGANMDTVYAFRVTITNELPNSHPVGPVTFRLVNQNVPEAEFPKIRFTPLSWDGVDFSTLTTQYSSTYHTVSYQLSDREITFGGLNGGGGQFLPSDGSQDLYFGIHIPTLAGSAGRNFFLVLVPSPEPTSLMLGAFGLIGGVLLVRRRRNKRPAEVAQT